MFRVGGGAGKRRRLSRSQLLLGIPVTFGVAAFLSALSAGSGADPTPASSTAASPAVAAPAAAAPAPAPAPDIAAGLDTTGAGPATPAAAA
ncbi:MAG: hypothetical protein ACRD0C_07740, partial [Acidimicrobiia bacterium]